MVQELIAPTRYPTKAQVEEAFEQNTAQLKWILDLASRGGLTRIHAMLDKDPQVLENWCSQY